MCRVFSAGFFLEKQSEYQVFIVNITIEEINETRKKLVVSVTAEETTEEENALVGDFMKEAQVPGFRAGKAPVGLIRGRYAKQIKEELGRRLTSKSYRYAMDESKLDIYTVVDFEGGEFKSGEDGELSLTVDINPDFNLPEYKGIETELSPTDVSDEEVDEAIDEIRRQRSDFKVVEREVQKGDFVKVSYEGKVDGQPIAELVPNSPIWGKQENTWEEAGAEGGYGVPVVVEGLAGMKVGEKKDVEMDFPEGHDVPELAGKKAVYSMEVHEVRERVLPEVNEEFLKSIKLESVEQLKDQIYDDLKGRKEQERRSDQRRQILDALSGRIEFPLPESALERETEMAMREIMSRNMQRGVPESELEEHKQEIYDGARRAAAARVKENILLSRIADAEEVKVENEDVQRAIMTEAMMSRTKPEDLVKEIQNDPSRLASIQQSIKVSKALDFLVEQAKVSEKKKS